MHRLALCASPKTVLHAKVYNMFCSTEMLPVLRAQCRLLCSHGVLGNRMVAQAPLLTSKRAASRWVCSGFTEVAGSTETTSNVSTQPLAPMSWDGRDRGCGSLTEEDIGSSFSLCGWVHRQRNLGGLQLSSGHTTTPKAVSDCHLSRDMTPRCGKP